MQQIRASRFFRHPTSHGRLPAARNDIGMSVSRHLFQDLWRGPLGVLITLHPPTKTMGPEATTQGYYVSPWGGEKVPKLQIVTIEDLFDGKSFKMPPNRLVAAFKQAAPAKTKKGKQQD